MHDELGYLWTSQVCVIDVLLWGPIIEAGKKFAICCVTLFLLFSPFFFRYVFIPPFFGLFFQLVPLLYVNCEWRIGTNVVEDEKIRNKAETP